MAAGNGSGRGRGRPLTLDDDIAERVRLALRGRNVLEAAGALAGVPRSTLFDWLRIGRDVVARLENGARRSEFTANERKLADFSDLIARAVAEAEAQSVALIGMAGTQPSIEKRRVHKVVGTTEGGVPIWVDEETTIEKPPDWRAIAWLTERRWDHWALRTKTEVSGPDGRDLEVKVSATEQVKLFLAGILERQATFAAAGLTPTNGASTEHAPAGDG